MSEREREDISLRTKAGLAKRKAEGIKLGRPHGTTSKVLNEHKKDVLAYKAKGLSLSAIGKIYGVTRQTVGAFLKG